MIDCEENSDYLHQEKMDTMSDAEHALYHSKGVPATMVWTNSDRQDHKEGRLVGNEFHFWSLGRVSTMRVTSVQDKYLLVLGESRVLAEILLDEVDK